MAILPANTDYTSKDFSSLRLRLIALIQSLFPTWTDFQVTNFGNILMEMFAFSLDVILFYQDNNAQESRITTATQRRNILALAKLINYTPALSVAATADETFTGVGLAVNVNLPAGTIVTTQDNPPISYQLLSPLVLAPGSPIATGSVENSTTEEDTYQGTGQADQAVALSETPFLGIVSIVGSSSGEWSQVDNFLLSGSGDKVFTISVDNNDVATVTFGDGTAGLMPSDILTITYKTGGGAAGNVEANTITKIPGTILDVDGNPATITVTNAEADGGVDEEFSALIQARAPLSIQNPTSSIARTDFETNALTFVGGLTRALMLTANENSQVPQNAGWLYLVPMGNPFAAPSPGVPSASLIQAVRSVFLSDNQGRAPRPAPLVFSLKTFGATYLDFAIMAKVYLTAAAAANSASVAAYKAAVLLALQTYFSPMLLTGQLNPDGSPIFGAPNPAIDFGYYLKQNSADPADAEFGQVPITELMKTVLDVTGTRAIGADALDFVVTTRTVAPDSTITAIETAVHHDINLNDEWFPRFLSVTLLNGDTGVDL